MRRKIRHLKRYKSYPKNVPKKLLQIFFALDCKVSHLANDRRVNSGVISALLNDGKEPKDSEVRQRLYLSHNPICKACHRRIVHHSDKPKVPKPDFIIEWEHLPKSERHDVIKSHLDAKKLLQKMKGK